MTVARVTTNAECSWYNLQLNTTVRLKSRREASPLPTAAHIDSNAARLNVTVAGRTERDNYQLEGEGRLDYSDNEQQLQK